MTLDELISEFAPEPAKVQALKSWFRKFQVPEEDITMTPTRDFISVKLPVAVVNHMFDVRGGGGQG
jgi:hypothetical protein